MMLTAMLVGSHAAWAASACTQSSYFFSTTLSCSYQSQSISTGTGETRQVRYQVPDGSAPEGGWPAVLMYQPSGAPILWAANEYMPAGVYHQVRLIEELLDRGYAVIAPAAGFYQYWLTNNVGMDGLIPYSSTPDYHYIDKVIAGLAGGQFGSVDMERLYATGMSSGGYNTSRMAVSFPGRFKALAIQSASYANCAGFYCNVPQSLPDSHPPTLFLHGGRDYVVPIGTMESYRERLDDQGVETQKVIAPTLGHEYLPAAPQAISDWFDSHFQ